MAGSFVVLTGASGAGKTTLAQAVQKTAPDCEVLFFDSIGVPSAEAMAAFGTGHDPGGAWQRAMTFRWMERIASMRADRPQSILFEGQMRIAFIQEALAAQGISDAKIVLLDCSDQVRVARLIHDRRQPELAVESMMAWGRYLRNEAIQAECEILDTGEVSLDESVRRIRSLLE